MQKITDTKKINRLIVICTIVYFVSYITRINLSAVMVDMVHNGIFTQKAIAFALTVCSVTYGIGQVVSGYLGDRFKPYNVLFTGLVITTFTNILVSFISNSSLLAVIWGINGFAQSMMWPPIVAILSRLLTESDYKKACVYVSWGSSFGTIFVYLTAPVVISMTGVRYVFIICACAAAFFSVFWKLDFKRSFASDFINADVVPVKNNSVKKEEKFSSYTVLVLGVIMLGIVMQGALRDGITNWMPTFVSDTFGAGSAVSILTGVVLPVFSIISFKVAAIVYEKFFDNEVRCAAVIFAVGTAALLLLYAVYDFSIILSVLLFAVICGTMHGVNIMLIAMTPPYFGKYNKVSLISGMLNSCTYIGSALSTYSVAVFRDISGWRNTILLFSVIALVGTLFCSIGAPVWKKFKTDK